MSDTGAVGVIELVTTRGIGVKSRRLVFGVLRIYRNVQTLLDYSERDSLTGLLNRKIFDDSFYKVSSLPLLDAKLDEGERRHASGSRYWLGVVDIDHFKTVNDRFGHLIGDEVLLLLSRIMRGAFRFSDQLYRFGGEEFVVLLLCNDEGRRRRRRSSAFAAWSAITRSRRPARSPSAWASRPSRSATPPPPPSNAPTAPCTTPSTTAATR